MEDNTALQKYKQSGEFGLKEIQSQKKQINEVFNEIMKENEHYGVIPGTSKRNVLLKPGAEIINYMYRLSASYKNEIINLDGDHREVISTCTLTHIPSGQIWGQSSGSCSTKEKKYRFRMGPVRFTGRAVPKEYWDLRKDEPYAALDLIGGKGHGTKKNPNTSIWEVVEMGEPIENPNPADEYNTVLKMAQKRAVNSATIAATAASDIFTVDIDEDMDQPPVDVSLGKQQTTTPTLAPEEDDSEKDWHEEEKRLSREGEQTTLDDSKIDPGKAKILYAKWKNIAGYDDDQKAQVMSDMGVDNWYKVKAKDFEKYRKHLDSFYR